MGGLGPLRQMLMKYLAQHPEARKMVQNGAAKVRQSPPFKKAEDRARAYYSKMVADAAAQQGRQQQQQKSQGKDGPKFSYFHEMKRKLLLEWHKNKGRVFAFVTANFFVLIMAFQFLPIVWHGMVSVVRALMAPSLEHKKGQPKPQPIADSDDAGEDAGDRSMRRKHKKRNSKLAGNGTDGTDDEDAIEMQRNRYVSPQERKMDSQQQKQAGPFSHLSEKLTSDSGDAKPTTSFGAAAGTFFSSSSLFDDSSTATSNKDSVQDHFNQMHQGMFQSSNEHNNMKIGFDTSFLVKMGDETEFTSSLERENLTGSQNSR